MGSQWQALKLKMLEGLDEMYKELSGMVAVKDGFAITQAEYNGWYDQD